MISLINNENKIRINRTESYTKSILFGKIKDLILHPISEIKNCQARNIIP